ncbi:MAG: helix-hairpin-helix domain-containing protein [Bacteroidia bacterium]|nr:helix-hairpin-helix domain-containing protein [Bacteroidia bacterium]
MANDYSFTHLEPRVLNRLLNFLNQVRSVADIKRLNPAATGSDYWIGDTVAQRLLEYRSQLESQRFEDPSQLGAIPGLGQDKLDELIQMISQPADAAFADAMRQQVLHANFELWFYPVQFNSEEQFLTTAQNPSLFTELIAQEVTRISLEKSGNELISYLVGDLVKRSYLEIIGHDSAAPYAFALWFYKFDADNWFSFNQVLEQTDRYLSGFGYESDRRELRFFKGFSSRGVLASAVSVEDLPVVVNYEEMSITLWIGQLND